MNMTTKQLKQSETRTIKRSQISLNPYNPKRHTEERIKMQKKNLQKVGYLGGITWNETTGNLIDGHRRIQAMDMYYGYDGSKESDYTVKVEVVQMNDKQEKEQLTFMAVGNTKAEMELIAKYFPDIDPESAGLNDEYIAEISAFIPDFAQVETFTIDDFKPPKTTPTTSNDEELKSAVKATKQAIKERCEEQARTESAYITLSFTSYNEKAEFCEMMGIDADARFAKGEEVLRLIE